jgi:hypothetical protein
LRVDGFTNRELTILDADEYARLADHSEKICDYFIFLTRSGVTFVVVEMKGGGFNADEVLAQLTRGAIVGQQLIGLGQRVTCYPLLLHGKGIHASDFKVLRQRRVNFQGQKLPILIARCGMRLVKVLKSYEA